jgi:hypothetical protein
MGPNSSKFDTLHCSSGGIFEAPSHHSVTHSRPPPPRIHARKLTPSLEKGTVDCTSEDALIHLKSYKYSSVDKSPISKYVLGPWVRLTWIRSPYSAHRQTPADMDNYSGMRSSTSCHYGLPRIW